MLQKLHHLLLGIGREMLFNSSGDKNRFRVNIHLCFHRGGFSPLQLFSQHGEGFSTLGICAGKL